MHACNYYCRNGQHCDLIYTTLEPRGWTDDDRRYVRAIVRDAYAAYSAGRLRVVDIEPAREAPPLPPDDRLEQIAGTAVGPHAYLVYYTDA